ncbi:helix-turn-helix domain-containing protein [Shewanella nanhaiensis]|uniref:Helix-turn-helix transcriptional regulator n=1 Tax=Shewanella nanhaiensis TaxID=2864872 RepID=A0ABS7E346_9GAMM|nr:helix-turn-helix transcriptional regulator [Shewanella nanhaiensis]MBW8184068.1 helix-turn-helix transcriptional regulator [Shewanella nanhaiensis]
MKRPSQPCLLSSELSLYIAGIYNSSQYLTSEQYKAHCIAGLTEFIPSEIFTWNISDTKQLPPQDNRFEYQAEQSGLVHSLTATTPSDLDANQIEIIQFILPHIAEGFRLNLLSKFYFSEKCSYRFKAVCNQKGEILEQEEGFTELLEMAGISNLQAILPRSPLSEGVYGFAGLISIVTQKNNYYIVELHFFGKDFNILSKKQLLICFFISQGLSNEEIAEKMSTSRKTTENHLANIYFKLNLSSRSILVSKLIAGQNALVAT